MELYEVTLTRHGKQITLVMRGDDYRQSVKIDKGCNARIKYGSGAMWYLVSIVPQLIRNTPGSL